MSIPKEPRQLMINLMYLVLLALLALNVSAEIINAFFALDKGNKESIATMNKQLDDTEKGITKLLEEPSKKEYKPILPAISEVRSLTKDFNAYVEDLRSNLIDAAGNENGTLDDGDYVEEKGKKKPKGKKNKDVTTRILAKPVADGGDGKGVELKEKVLDTREKMLAAYKNLLTEYGKKPFGLGEEEVKSKIQSMEANLTLKIDDESWTASDKKSWEEYKFKQMPLAAVLPILSKMQSDAKTAEAAIVNEMAGFAGGREIVFDKFFPVVNAKKAYVISGEKFEADISVGTYSSSISPSDISISVNGQSLRVNEDGVAKYSTTTSGTGVKKLSMSASVRNPLTGETSKGESTFDYEVGRRSVAVSPDKMNVFYIGVDNPISVAAAGVSSNDLNVRGSGAGIKMNRTGQGKYNVTVSQPGEANITVSGGGLNDKFGFRVKRIPDPRPALGKQSGGTMGNGTFKAQRGLLAWLDDFDFDAKCNIQGFKLVRVPKREDAIESPNQGGSFNSQSLRIVKAAKPGDVYYFDGIKARCPGDKAGRPLPSIVFNIK